jgi:hypothetical protein
MHSYICTAKYQYVNRHKLKFEKGLVPYLTTLSTAQPVVIGPVMNNKTEGLWKEAATA